MYRNDKGNLQLVPSLLQKVLSGCVSASLMYATHLENSPSPIYRVVRPEIRTSHWVTSCIQSRLAFRTNNTPVNAHAITPPTPTVPYLCAYMFLLMNRLGMYVYSSPNYNPMCCIRYSPQRRSQHCRVRKQTNRRGNCLPALLLPHGPLQHLISFCLEPSLLGELSPFIIHLPHTPVGSIRCAASTILFYPSRDDGAILNLTGTIEALCDLVYISPEASVITYTLYQEFCLEHRLACAGDCNIITKDNDPAKSQLCQYRKFTTRQHV